MAPKTARKLINDALEDLSERDFDKFRNALLNRKDEPRVKRKQVEGADDLKVTDVLVSTFTETGAPAMVIKLLKEIGCNDDAEKLETEIGGQSSNPGSSDISAVRPSAGAEGGCTGADFVDKHRAALIDRVSNIGPILDELLEKKVITTQEAYDAISAIPTNREKMRKLYSGPLNSAGPKGKDVFYKFLERTEKYLIDELKE